MRGFQLALHDQAEYTKPSLSELELEHQSSAYLQGGEPALALCSLLPGSLGSQLLRCLLVLGRLLCSTRPGSTLPANPQAQSELVLQSAGSCAQ